MEDTHEEEDLGLPDHLSEEGRDLISGVLEDLEGDEEPDALLWGSLLQAAELVTAADALDEVAREAGYVAEGSTGQTVVHPAAVESRQARTGAAKILVGLRGKPETRHRFASGAGGSASRAASKRWAQSRSGGRSRKGRQ